MCLRVPLATWAIAAALAYLGSDPAVAVASGNEGKHAQARVVGAGRCSATACHGSPEPVPGRRTLGNESTTWVTRDPHAKAYAVLLTDWSRTIASNLGRSSKTTVPAHKDPRCLACHATTLAAEEPDLSRTLRQDGVSCESCHGAAEHWLARHITEDWDLIHDEHRERQFGMARLDDLSRRAERCASCHVGERARPGRPAREVNHDLIAAGHPRLCFEFSAFLANLPVHWIEKDRNAGADMPARAWAVGQVVSARAAAGLLASRASEAATPSARDRPSSWPELAEYDCASCHHVFRATNGRGPGSATSLRRTGTPSWGSWYYGLMSSASLAGSSEIRTSVQRLRVAMEVPLPDAGVVTSEAEQTSMALTRWLMEVDDRALQRFPVPALIQAIRHEDLPATEDVDWDLATQRYLALVPLRQALPRETRDSQGLFADLLQRRDRVLAPFLPEYAGRSGRASSLGLRLHQVKD